MNALIQWGWSPFFEEQLTDEEKITHSVARIVEPLRGLSRAVGTWGEVWAETPMAIPPAVGDWVVGKLRDHGTEEKRFSVDRTLERKNRLSRSAPGGKGYEQVLCANIDCVFIVLALTQEFQPRALQSYLEVVKNAGIPAVIWLTKADEGVSSSERVAEIRSLAPNTPLHLVSVHQGIGMNAIDPYFVGAPTVVLLGASGAGKSTLTNYLLKTEAQRVSEVREKDQKGRHTTTGRRLHLLPGGGMIIDSPGIREIQLWESSPEAAAPPVKKKQKSLKHSRSRRQAQEED